jgi:hypothetical protein
MDEKDIEAPFPREPWRRLLADSADAPPETTDARIRAAARRELAPRGRRWWLPASLAASFVLAVFIVQSQFGTLRAPTRTDADGGAGGAINARNIEREKSREVREPGRSAAAPSPPSASKPEAVAPEPQDYAYEDSELAADSAGVSPRVGGPEHELRAATEVPEEAVAPRPEAESGFVPAAPAATKTPEDWYAEIEKLRADGRMEEAERELEQLKKAFPGWLEKHLANQPER